MKRAAATLFTCLVVAMGAIAGLSLASETQFERLPQGSIAQAPASPSPSPSPVASPSPSPEAKEVAGVFPWWILIAAGGGIFLIGLAIWLFPARAS